MKLVSHQKNKSDVIKPNNILNNVMINPFDLRAEAKKTSDTPKKMIVRINKQIILPNDFSSLILSKDEGIAIKTVKAGIKEPDSDMTRKNVETPTLLRKNTKSASADKKIMLSPSVKQEEKGQRLAAGVLEKAEKVSPIEKLRVKQILQDFNEMNKKKLGKTNNKVSLKPNSAMNVFLQKQGPASLLKRSGIAAAKTSPTRNLIESKGEPRATEETSPFDKEKLAEGEKEFFEARIYYKNQTKDYKFNIKGKTSDWLIDQMIQKTNQIKTDDDSIIGFANTSRLFLLDYYATLMSRDISFLKGLKLEYEVISHKTSEVKESVSMKDFLFIKMIGTGGFSKVFVGTYISERNNKFYRGAWRPTIPKSKEKNVRERFSTGGGKYSSLARKKDTGKFYALKLIDRQFISKNKKEGIIKNEREILAALNHPFIVNLHFAFKTRNYLVFAMEFCAGGELYYHLRQRKRFKERQALLYFLELCLAIMYLHGKNIIYRDLKPENILIDIDGHIKLADFGLAKPNISQDEMAYSFCGSAEYMSPEMLRKRGHGQMVDIYSLGTILYEFVTGTPPFYSKNLDKMYNNILNDELAFPEGIPLSKELRSLLASLLSKNPEERIGFQQGVREILSHPWCNQLKIMDVFHKRIKAPIQPDYITLYFEDIQEKDIDPIVYEKVTEDIYRPQTVGENSGQDSWFSDFYFEKLQLVEGKNKEDCKRASSASRLLTSVAAENNKPVVAAGPSQQSASSSLQTTAPQSPTIDKTRSNRGEKRLLANSLDRNTLNIGVVKKAEENTRKETLPEQRENFHQETKNGISKVILNEKQRKMIDIYSCKNQNYQNLKLNLKKKNLSLSPQHSNASISSIMSSSRKDITTKHSNQAASSSPSVRVISQTLKSKIKNFFSKNERLPQFYLKRRQDGEQSSLDSKRTLKSESIREITEIFVGNQVPSNLLSRNNSKVEIPLDNIKSSQTILLNNNINMTRLKQNYLPVKVNAINKEDQS